MTVHWFAYNHNKTYSVMLLIVMGIVHCQHCAELLCWDYWEDTGTILGQFGDYTGTVLGLYWDYFGTILGLYWDYFGTILGQFWDYYGTILGLFWDCFSDQCWANLGHLGQAISRPSGAIYSVTFES
jgi:hypothetical protein